MSNEPQTLSEITNGACRWASCFTAANASLLYGAALGVSKIPGEALQHASLGVSGAAVYLANKHFVIPTADKAWKTAKNGSKKQLMRTLAAGLVAAGIGVASGVGIHSTYNSENTAQTVEKNDRGLQSYRLVDDLRFPTDGSLRISSHYSKRRKHPISGQIKPHNGMDIAGPEGSDVYAVNGGIVEVAGTKGANGKWVKINHLDGNRSNYLHLSKLSVKRGSRVEAGDKVGEIGNTGNATGHHLHFEYIKNGRAINPIAGRGYHASVVK